jgi:long-chain acyl-CoA synthetase
MDKVWLKSYDQGVPTEINPDKYTSLAALFDESIQKYGKKIAFTNMGVACSYNEIEKLSKAFALYLTEVIKLPKQSRVAIMLPNLLQYPVAMFGALRAGMIVVNVNPLYTVNELSHILKDSGAECIVILANFAHVLEKALPSSKIKQVVVTELGDLLGIKGIAINIALKYIKKMVPKTNLSSKTTISFKKSLDLGKKCLGLEAAPIIVSNEDIAYLQYTGGTTGVFKGAVLTHRNMVANVLQATAWIQPAFDKGHALDGVITALPLYHIFSLTANCLTFFRLGSTNILITNPRDIPAFIKELKRQPFSAITGVNTLFSALLHHRSFKTVDFSHLLITLGGGMAVQKKVAHSWRELTGKPLIEAYGLTEASPAVCINPFSLEEYNGCIGLPISSTEISIRDEQDQECSIGVAGELWIKGPQVMREYWQQPEETKMVLTSDGWLKTGDIASVDVKGFVKIVDRKKDLILVSGFNVYPNEIEDIISMHPKVKEVAVVGVPVEGAGELVKAFIVPLDPSLTAAEIIQHCRQYLTNYKIPKKVEFRQELPKTNVGKVLRRALREQKSMPSS